MSERPTPGCDHPEHWSEQAVRELLENVHDDRVFVVEERIVWVSGMNSHCKQVAEDIAKTLLMHDVPAGLVHDDGIHAVDNGGVQFCYGVSA